ncbi:MAG: nuclear transport factor 2 family protein [Ilumatobacteraceae bacterium]
MSQFGWKFDHIGAAAMPSADRAADPTGSTRADVEAIVATTIAYTWAIDEHDWDRLRDVFDADCVAQLGSELSVGIDAIIARISRTLGPLDCSQHLLGNHEVTVAGDEARSRCYFQAQHVRVGAPGGDQLLIAGRYVDEWRRTPKGWRIARRDLISMWRSGNPAVVRPGPSTA